MSLKFYFIKGNIIDESVLLAHLTYIMSDSTPPPEHPLGIMTTADRDTWTKTRMQLINAGKYHFILANYIALFINFI